MLSQSTHANRSSTVLSQIVLQLRSGKTHSDRVKGNVCGDLRHCLTCPEKNIGKC